jgi:hypothetical protein
MKKMVLSLFNFQFKIPAKKNKKIDFLKILINFYNFKIYHLNITL